MWQKEAVVLCLCCFDYEILVLFRSFSLVILQASAARVQHFKKASQNMANSHLPVLRSSTCNDGTRRRNTSTLVPISRSPTSKDSARWEKLGTYAIYILSAGTTIILLAVGLLCFLWFSNHTNTTWRLIVINNWATRAVTLGSIAIRWAVTSQSVVLTSILAGLALEQHGISLHQFATVSLLRYSNTGPINLLQYYFTNLEFGPGMWVPALVALLSITTTLSQFSSTSLLSDVQIGTVTGFPQTLTMPSGINNNFGLNQSVMSLQHIAPDYWLTKPPSYPTFAEYSEAPIIADDVADTGVKLRALLPVEPAGSPLPLHMFSGNATVFDARVTCIRPVIQGAVLHVTTRGANTTFYNLVGNVLPNRAVGNIIPNVNNTGTPFNCTLPTLYGGPRPYTAGPIGGVTTFCFLDRRAGGLLSRLTAWDNSSLHHYWTSGRTYTAFSDEGEGGYVTQGAPGLPGRLVSPVGSSYLVLNIGGDQVSERAHKANLDISDWVSKNHGPWLNMSTTLGDSTLFASICYDGLQMAGSGDISGSTIDLNVTATSGWDLQSPTVSWNNSRRLASTDGVRRQLGATNASLSLESRGLLALELTGIDDQLRASARNINMTDTLGSGPDTVPWGWGLISSTLNPARQGFQPGNSSAVFALDSQLALYSNDYYLIANYVLSMIAQDILEETQNPALAWQAHTTMLLRMAYYDMMAIFSHDDSQTVILYETASFPRSSRGLVAVLFVLIAHLALVVVTVTLFYTSTQYSTVGNAWQATAQTMTADTELILSKSAMATDNEVEKMLKRAGKGRVRVRLGDPGNGDGVRLGRLHGGLCTS